MRLVRREPFALEGERVPASRGSPRAGHTSMMKPRPSGHEDGEKGVQGPPRTPRCAPSLRPLARAAARSVWAAVAGAGRRVRTEEQARAGACPRVRHTPGDGRQRPVTGPAARRSSLAERERGGAERASGQATTPTPPSCPIRPLCGRSRRGATVLRQCPGPSRRSGGTLGTVTWSAYAGPPVGPLPPRG